MATSILPGAWDTPSSRYAQSFKSVHGHIAFQRLRICRRSGESNSTVRSNFPAANATHAVTDILGSDRLVLKSHAAETDP